jgi:hypothetical protein
MTPEDENVHLKAENAALQKQVLVLATRVQELEARLAKDRHNSTIVVSHRRVMDCPENEESAAAQRTS